MRRENVAVTATRPELGSVQLLPEGLEDGGQVHRCVPNWSNTGACVKRLVEVPSCAQVLVKVGPRDSRARLYLFF